MDQRVMMDLSHPTQFDLDQLANDLGTPPDAPLAMPVQVLETRAVTLLSLLRLLPVRRIRVGH
jgi:hypothetical protein